MEYKVKNIILKEQQVASKLLKGGKKAIGKDTVDFLRRMDRKFGVAVGTAEKIVAKDMAAIKKELGTVIKKDIAGGVQKSATHGLTSEGERMARELTMKEVLMSDRQLTTGEITAIRDRNFKFVKDQYAIGEARAAKAAAKPKPAPKPAPAPGGAGGAKPPKPTKPKGGGMPLKKKLKIAGKVLKGVGALGVGILAWWLWKNFEQFMNEGITEENAKEALAPLAERIIKFLQIYPCIGDILDDDGVSLDINTNGNIAVLMPNTGVPEYDQAGGLGFFINGIVYKLSQPKATGSYTCGGAEPLAEDYFNFLINKNLLEQTVPYKDNTNNTEGEYTLEVGDDNPNTGIGGITIKWQTDANGKNVYVNSGSEADKRNNCDNKPLPHEKGCYSAEISEVQSCLDGVYVDGILNDVTIKKLTSLGYDMSQGLTWETYSAVLTKCGETPHPDAKPQAQQQVEPQQVQERYKKLITNKPTLLSLIKR